MKQNKQGEASQKHLGGVKKRLRWAAVLVGILIMSLSLSGCKNFVETDVSAETNSIKQTASETTNAKTLTDKKNEFTTEPMIRDELLEEMLYDVEINGQKLSLPCSSKDLCLNTDLGLEPYKECSVYYDDDDNMYHYIFCIPLSVDMYIDVRYRSDKSNEAELSADKMYSFFISASLKDFNENYTFRLGQINNYSNMTQEDVEKILGDGDSDEKLYSTSRYKLDDSRVISIVYGNNLYVESIGCYWL